MSNPVNRPLTIITDASSRNRPGTGRDLRTSRETGNPLWIDVINDLALDGSESLVEQAEPMAARVGRLKRRATQAGLPAIYINDNFGQWRSDSEQSGEEGLQDVRIVEALCDAKRLRRPVVRRPFERRLRLTSNQRISRPGVKKSDLVKVRSASR